MDEIKPRLQSRSAITRPVLDYLKFALLTFYDLLVIHDRVLDDHGLQGLAGGKYFG